MTNVKELILAKLDEINDLLLNATCEGMDIEHEDCESVYRELTGALCTAEETVDYYLD